MTAHRITRNARPMDYTAGLQPMSAEDEAFWQSRRGDQQAVRESIRIGKWLCGAVVAALVVLWAAHGAFPNWGN